MMKKLLCTVLFTVLALGLSNAQSVTVTGLGNLIAGDGTNTPTVTDDTDFGSLDVAATGITHTFTVTNTTGADIVLLGLNPLTGANASDFSQMDVADPLLVAGGTTTFTVTFDPDSPAGLKTAVVSLGVNNLSTGLETYIFNIEGTATEVTNPNINISGNGETIVSPDLSPSTVDGTDFGNVDVASGSVTQTFLIANLGNAPLNLTGASLVLVSGGGGDFTVTDLPTTPIPALSTSSFDITFDPSVTGVITANVLVQSDDPDTPNYLFSITGFGTEAEADIDVSGNGVSIVSPDLSPSITDDTNFGQADVTTGSVTNTFTITNTGDAPLNLTGATLVLISGGGGAFTVTNLPSTPIAASASTTFDITFDPSSTGTVTANVLIQNDDPDAESNFLFSIQGEGVIIPIEPEIDIQGLGNSIASGDTTPSVADDTDFGQVDVTSGNLAHTFTILNTGNGDLTLTGASPFVTISGANAADFTLTAIPSSTIGTAGSTTFAITYNPSVVGISNATITIINDDTDESNYTFDIVGEGIDANAGSQLLITQYYQGLDDTGLNDGSNNWIEVKNVSTTASFPGSYYLALFIDTAGTINGGIASNTPDESILIPALSPGEVALFNRSGASLPTSGNLGAVSITATEVCRFDGDDIIVISTTNDSNAYNSRIDIIGTVGTNSEVDWGSDVSLIKGCGTTESPSTTYDPNDYITLTLDEVNNASSFVGSPDLPNIALGVQTVGPTIFTTSWDNGVPDKTKQAIINGSYVGGTSFEACDLTINSGTNINLNSGGAYILVDGNLTVNGTFAIGDTESLIMTDPDATIVGQISKTEISEPLNNSRDYTYWSSPVNTTTNSVFTGVSNIFQWNTTALVWDLASSTTMNDGRGYIAQAPAGSTQHTVTFTGVPYNGLVLEPIFFNNDGLDNDYNLMGNPYPSAIDIDQFISDSNNNEILNNSIDGTIYLWTHNTAAIEDNGADADYVRSDYATYNLAGGTASANGGPAPTNNIGSGQGFFVRSVSNGTVEFNNEMRLDEDGNPLANTQFFKSSKKTVEKDRLWLDMTTEEGAFNQVLIGFFEKATDAEDRGYDGLKLGGGNLTFYSKIDNDKKYAIQGLGAFNPSKEITLGFDTSVERTFKITMSKIEGALKDEEVFLLDNVTNVLHDLKLEPYEFEAIEGDYSNRFTLKFNSGVLSTDDVELNNSFIVFHDNNTLNIKASDEISELKVYDITGRLLIDSEPKSSAFELPVQNIKIGTVLILNATMKNGSTVSKKAIKY